LTGEDGNVFAIIGRVRRALLAGGVPGDQVKTFLIEAFESNGYDDALRTVMEWVNVK